MYNDAKTGDDMGFNLENDQEKKSPEEKKLALIKKFFEMLRGSEGTGEQNINIENQMDGTYMK
jgi:hypothetical protein